MPARGALLLLLLLQLLLRASLAPQAARAAVAVGALPPAAGASPGRPGSSSTRPVSPGFIGLSIETYSALAMLGPAAEPRVAMAQALRNIYDLTPGPHEGAVLRIGGDSSDSSCWAGAEPGVVPAGCQCSYNLSSADLEAYRAFAAAAPNVSFVLGTNLGCGSPALAAAHAAAVGAAGLWPLVRGMSPGTQSQDTSSYKTPRLVARV